VNGKISLVRKLLFTVIFLILASVSSLADRKLSVAETILVAVQKQAAHQHKGIFLIFSAAWSGPCKRLDMFLAAPANREIIDKYFVVARLNVAEQYGGDPKLNTPGAEKLFVKYGGPGNDVPFVALLNTRAELIVNSNRPVGEDKVETIGYPDEPLQILWFTTMLKKAAPTMSESEAQAVSDWLKKSAIHHEKPEHHRMPRSS
jgi:hypothetical protein